MKKISNVVVATVLTCSAINSPVYADSELTTMREIDAAYWANAQQICPEEANLILQYSPNAQRIFSTLFLPRSLNDEARNELLNKIGDYGGFPHSPEMMQIFLYSIMQGAQILAMSNLDADYRRHLRDPEHSYVHSRQEARAFTSFVECMRPVGTRFTSSEEPRVSEEAQRVTDDFCKNRYEHDNRLIALDITELTEETYRQVTEQLSTQLCEFE